MLADGAYEVRRLNLFPQRGPGGIVKFGTSFPFDPKRAARALGCMFTIAKSNSRIKRLYIYNFAAAQPDSSFDSGLVNTDGTKRPGWDVVKARKAGPCRK